MRQKCIVGYVGLDNPLKVELLLLGLRSSLFERCLRRCQHLRSDFLVNAKLLVGGRLRSKASGRTNRATRLGTNLPADGIDATAERGTGGIARRGSERQL